MSRVVTAIALLISLVFVIIFTFSYNDSTGRLEDILTYCNSAKKLSLTKDNLTKNNNESGNGTENSLKACLGADFFYQTSAENREYSVVTDYKVKSNLDVVGRILLYAYPPSILKITNGITVNTDLGLKVISNKDTEDDEKFSKSIKSNPQQVLYNAGKDLTFIIYLYGTGILPLLYGVLGSTTFLLRRSLSDRPDDYKIVTSAVTTGMRIGLGGVAGVIIGWLWVPNEMTSVKSLANAQFVLAFIAGFSIDIVFSIMDRIVQSFEPGAK